MNKFRKRIVILVSLGLIMNVIPRAQKIVAQEDDSTVLKAKIDRFSHEIEDKVIQWRRDIHQHPELSNREFRTAQLIAEHLRNLGMDVKTEVAHTGVVALLRGKKKTPVVALRADMDALPVTEALDLPFASKVKTIYNGQEVGVMHACGHDAHSAILMGVAEVLSGLRNDLPGSVKFIFQPAEEGAPEGEDGGAQLMIRGGVLENPKPDAFFGLHVFPFPVGSIQYRAGPIMASVDGLRIEVKGKQTHGAIPWGGIDPIVVSAQIVMALQSIVSRQIDITEAPAIISIGRIQGGVRSNIIPDRVQMVGTIRSLDPHMRQDIHDRIQNTARAIAESAGAVAEVSISLGNPVVVNDPELTNQMLPTLEEVVGRSNLIQITPKTVAEDVSYFLQDIPGIYFFLGITPRDASPDEIFMNHSPCFYVDEEALIIGVRALSQLTADYLLMNN